MSRSLSISNADLATQDAKNKSSSGVRSASVSSSFFNSTRANEASGVNTDTELNANIDIVGAINNLKLDEEDESEEEEKDTGLDRVGSHSQSTHDKNTSASVEGTNFGFPVYPPHPPNPYYFPPYQGSVTPQQQLKVNNGVQPPVTYSSGWNGHPGGFDSQFNGLSHQGYAPVSEPPLNQNRDETNVPFIKPLELPDSKEDAQSKLSNGLSLSQGETRTVTSNEQEPNGNISDKNDDSRKPFDHTQSTGAVAPQHVNLSQTPPFNPFSPMSMTHPIGPGVPPGVPSPMMPYNYPPPHQPTSREFNNFNMKLGTNAPLPHPPAHFNPGPSPPNTAIPSGGSVWNSHQSGNVPRDASQQPTPPHIGNPPYPMGPQHVPPMPQQQHQHHHHQHHHRQQQQFQHHMHPLQFQGGGGNGAPFMQNQYNRGHYNRRGNKHGHQYQNYGHNYGMGQFGNGGNYRHRKGEDANKYQNAKIEDYKGHILDLCGDQHGCRFLQRELIKEQEGIAKGEGNKADELDNKEKVDESLATMVFNELDDDIVNLMLDSFGNYLIQKLVECITDEQRLELIKKSRSQFNRIALDSHGTRALQKLIECVGKTKDEADVKGDELQDESARLIIESLAPTIVSLSKDLNGNHVVQKCLISLSNETNQVIYDTIKDNCEVVACHRHGCCVLQRCLDYGNNQQIDALSHEITTKLDIFTADPYGNYVVQYVLTHGDRQSIDTIFAYLQSNFYQLSIHKFGSNVLEKSLRLNNTKQSSILIDELLKLSSDQFLKVLNDSYGNYVLQTCLDVAQLDQMTKLNEVLVPLLPDIKSTPHGKRIVNKLQ
ncbi:hypothetical protein CORT_0B03630 [Candida orthopsilosis Co 90-125]|uniref:PUM-HD domain-containing protein n=1 Tax=Candida orthopsilosis (strain 90-125) TaxID=1136231 RepID=H8X131_CANO9|nr:hypothetical protein CORT_0B03630 [Candida orthopsilosis Co 90-125]CCG22071.1 hypothetical protein CORT_0B03630 [Candida orthopsilosis Co 90-125]